MSVLGRRHLESGCGGARNSNFSAPSVYLVNSVQKRRARSSHNSAVPSVTPGPSPVVLCCNLRCQASFGLTLKKHFLAGENKTNIELN